MRAVGKRFKYFTITAVILALAACGDKQSNSSVVSDQLAFQEAVKNAQPGDTIVLANGKWSDFEILFTGEGEEGNPIRLVAETKGKVILTGQSNLRLAGNHLEVSGLVFKDGYSPTQEVISFRRNKNHLANNSRVTEVVIDDFNATERQETDFWVMMYGKNNRFDHSHLARKRNKGVTMAVRLNTEDSQENHHKIDHNYFGPRSILGSNGGETLRIGTSHHSRTNSFTVVENNYFDRCDGELEIISNKSGKNKFLNNTFYESRGTLTMRHGNNNLVEGNVFFGNGADHTGGIRVINAGQTIRNNYMEGLKGTRFGGALVVMNGVPNGPINRYDPVIDAVIENNSLINSDNIQLGAGSDEERSGTPKSSRFENNLIINDNGLDVFTVYDDMSGIAFKGNVLGSMDPPEFTKGFVRKSVVLQSRADGLSFPVGLDKIGIDKGLEVTTKDMTGVSWYPKADSAVAFGSGKVISVKPGDRTLSIAVNKAEAGDTIVLSPGSYVASKFLLVDKPITLKGGENTKITFERSTLFEILDGGSLQLQDIEISGKDSPDYAGNSVIRTSPYSMMKNYRLDISGVKFVDLDTNHSFNVLSAAKNTFADYIAVRGSSFENVTGAVFKLDKEDDDYGIYNAEYLTISDSSFKNIGGDIVDYYRGGRDESTFGPHFSLTGSRFDNVGFDKRNSSKSSLFLHGVQVTDITNNTFVNSAKFVINHTVGEPKTKIKKNSFTNTASPAVNELNSDLENTAMISDNQGLKP
jgi:poly(beta-D-mannuronate) lyase